MGIPKTKTPESLNIQLYARPRGNCQWQCPDCGNLHSTSKGLWNVARVQCHRCERKFRVGIGFHTNPLAPDAFWAGDFPPDGVANKLSTPTMKADILVGRLYGILDWKCPSCDRTQAWTVDFTLQRADCFYCTAGWKVQLILYRPGGNGVRTRCPLDWTPFTCADVPV